MKGHKGWPRPLAIKAAYRPRHCRCSRRHSAFRFTMFDLERREHVAETVVTR